MLIRLAIAGGVVLGAFIAGRLVKKMLEGVRGEGLVFLWLREVGSDVFWLVSGVGIWGGVAIAVSEVRVYAIARFLVLFQVFLFVALAGVAFISIASKVLEERIKDMEDLSPRDKVNYLTFIPVAASIIKMVLWVCSLIGLLGVSGFDISPILNLGAVIFAVFGIAGQDSIKDVLSTVKIFWDRVLYVGSVVKFPGMKQGTVVSITLWNTKVLLDGEPKTYYLIANRDVNKLIIISHPL
jgi:small-conductance mechanosensitive channel